MTAHSTGLVLPLGPRSSGDEWVDLIEFGDVSLECDLEVVAGLQVQPEPARGADARESRSEVRHARRPSRSLCEGRDSATPLT